MVDLFGSFCCSTKSHCAKMKQLRSENTDLSSVMKCNDKLLTVTVCSCSEQVSWNRLRVGHNRNRIHGISAIQEPKNHKVWANVVQSFSPNPFQLQFVRAFLETLALHVFVSVKQ